MRKQKKTGKLFTPIVTIAFCMLMGIILVTIFADFIAPYDPNEQDMSQSLQGPSAEHWLGTDKNGRDTFSRVLYGGRTSLVGGLIVVAISFVIGAPLGIFSGYYGKIVDTIIMRACDVLLAFPSLLLAFIFVAILGRGLTTSVIALGVVFVPGVARLARSLTLVEKEKIYVESYRSQGAGTLRILFLHILPNIISTILVQLTIDLAYAILDIAALSFLGMGVQPPTSDWGALLETGRQYALINPIMVIAPGVAIILTVISLNLFSDGLQRYWDPRQRKVPTFKQYDKWLKKKSAGEKYAG